MNLELSTGEMRYKRGYKTRTMLKIALKEEKEERRLAIRKALYH